MMLLYLKQAWEFMKQNKLYSSLYVAGTALAIAMAMLFVLIYYIKMAPVYPEMNRDRTLVVGAISWIRLDGTYTYNSGLSHEAMKTFFILWRMLRL
ncbi:MAG: hypothetical protein LUF04_02835 [Bacteroides sp.]|nr:hypothetical protein [Bacteroides sp.]